MSTQPPRYTERDRIIEGTIHVPPEDVEALVSLLERLRQHREVLSTPAEARAFRRFSFRLGREIDPEDGCLWLCDFCGEPLGQDYTDGVYEVVETAAKPATRTRPAVEAKLKRYHPDCFLKGETP